jgi:hypothetical protein
MISVVTPLSTAMALLVVPKSIPKSIVVLVILVANSGRGRDDDFTHLDDMLLPINRWF